MFSEFDLDEKLRLNEKYVFRKLKRTSNREWKFYSIQLSIAIQTECIITLSRIVQHRKQARAWRSRKSPNRIARASYFNAIKSLQHTAIDLNRSISLLSSATNVNHFKFSTTHSSNNKSRTSKQLKKFAHFVEALMQHESFTFQHWETTTSIVLFFLQNIKSQNIKTFSKIDQTMISIKA